MRTIYSVVALVACLGVISLAQAGSINLDDLYNAGNPFIGDDVTFSNLIESNGTGSATTNYYQTPSVSGNDLNLTPQNLRVEILPGPGSDTVASRLEMEIATTGGTTIDEISFRQMVEYELLGARANDASADVIVDYSWEVLEGAMVGAMGGSSVMFSATATPNASGSWNTDFVVNIGAVAAGTRRVRFEFENRISGEAERSGLAFAGSMQQPGIDIQVTVVPEPAAEMLVVVGALAMVWARRIIC